MRYLMLLLLAIPVQKVVGQRALTVTVVDRSMHAPVYGARVEVISSGISVTEGHTAIDGRWVFQVGTATYSIPESGFLVGHPYPNPSGGSTTIPFRTESPGKVVVVLLDLLGRTIAQISKVAPAGSHSAQLELSGLARGTYLVQMRAGPRQEVRSVALERFGSGEPRVDIEVGARVSGPTPAVAGKSTSANSDYVLKVSAPSFATKTSFVRLNGDLDLTVELDARGRPEDVNSIDMELIRIPAGSFRMGSDRGFPAEKPVHEVTLSGDFWIGKYEVTQGQYFEITGRRPSNFIGDERLPVEMVSWNDAVDFANALSIREGLIPCYDAGRDVAGGDIYHCLGYRLPSEAEWEYAARSGTATTYSFGDDPAVAAEFAWYSVHATAAVGGRLPNPWGLCDVHGNVWEWVNDGYSLAYYAESPSQNPPGPVGAPTRVQRGGSWYNGVSRLTSATRESEGTFSYNYGSGFRLARSAR